MTDDLVKRLRDKVEASKIYDDDEELLDEAADRIEKLEAALREIRNWDVACYWNDAGPLASHMQSVARKALEGVQ